jgi:hypothetical protein
MRQEVDPDSEELITTSHPQRLKNPDTPMGETSSDRLRGKRGFGSGCDHHDSGPHDERKGQGVVHPPVTERMAVGNAEPEGEDIEVRQLGTQGPQRHSRRSRMPGRSSFPNESATNPRVNADAC